MVRIPPAPPTHADLRVAVVRSRFNEEVTARLASGAVAAFRAAGIPAAQIFELEVAGAIELAFAADLAIRDLGVDAVACVGAVIRGDTDHYEHVCRIAGDAIARVALDRQVPVAFGVLTCDDEAQALARAGGAAGNKGTDAARTALELALLARATRAHGRS
ncbi:MAG: 6,7-dimethyl-8-ribityllumazine synthase [Planctomycetes bacterium]|nr:6,7-dimethyl-8-ribityllumazine synthase [Planctomycetota bacterium]